MTRRPFGAEPPGASARRSSPIDLKAAARTVGAVFGYSVLLVAVMATVLFLTFTVAS